MQLQSALHATITADSYNFRRMKTGCWWLEEREQRVERLRTGRTIGKAAWQEEEGAGWARSRQEAKLRGRGCFSCPTRQLPGGSHLWAPRTSVPAPLDTQSWFMNAQYHWGIFTLLIQQRVSSHLCKFLIHTVLSPMLMGSSVCSVLF